MTWFFAFLIVAVMGVVAVVASGRGGSMAETYDDRPDSRVQADGPLTAADLRAVRFSTAFRGYRMSEVDSLLDRLAAEMTPVATAPEREPDARVAPADGPLATEGPGPVEHRGPAENRSPAEHPAPAEAHHRVQSAGEPGTPDDGAR